MVVTLKFVLPIIILLVHLDKFSCPSAQWIPGTDGNPGRAGNPGIPPELLDQWRVAYRNGNSGQFPSSPFLSTDQSHLYSPPPIYMGGDGITAGAGANILHQSDLSSFPGNGAGTLANNGHLYGQLNMPNQGPPPPPQSSVPTNSKSISGDYCFEPLVSCDTTNTLLYCIQGRCTCPNQWTLTPGNAPLNTVWHPEVKRCVSAVGSGCHLLTSFSQHPMVPVPPTARLTAVSAYPSRAATLNHPPESSFSSSSPTQQIASTIIKGLIGLPTTGGSTTGGMGYVFCQPGVQCVRHPAAGHQEIGVCAGAVVNKVNSFSIFLFTLLTVLVLGHFQT